MTKQKGLGNQGITNSESDTLIQDVVRTNSDLNSYVEEYLLKDLLIQKQK
ncbi:MAG: hypothetical protein AABY22_34960 [Nanoarchaeota archaeon]